MPSVKQNWAIAKYSVKTWQLPHNMQMKKNVDTSKFIERLEELRKEKGVTYADISRATNLTQTAFSKWLKGTRLPNIDSIIILVNYFGCTAGYLIGTEN